MGLAKVSADRTVVQEAHPAVVERGVNVDIFPVDVFPTAVPMRRCTAPPSASCVGSSRSRRFGQTRRGRYKRAIVTHGQRALRLLTVSCIQRVLTSFACAYRRSSITRLGIVTGPLVWNVNGEVVGEPIALAFEGMSFPGPSDPDRVLGASYGTYMELPPEAARIGHGNTTFWCN